MEMERTLKGGEEDGLLRKISSDEKKIGVNSKGKEEE